MRICLPRCRPPSPPSSSSAPPTRRSSCRPRWRGRSSAAPPTSTSSCFSTGPRSPGSAPSGPSAGTRSCAERRSAAGRRASLARQALRRDPGPGRRVARRPRRRVLHAPGSVGLPAYGARYPRELSGGEQQRVALARALVTRPAVLLLDEPLGALDKQLRDHMQIELKSLQREVGITTIYVTHDQGEALTMSDRIAVMRDGRLEQIGTPRDIYESPRTVFVAGFIGTTNLLPVRVLTGTEVEWGRARVRTAAPAGGPGASVTLALRPERVRLEPDG